jgi:hypothetical protein
MGAVRHQRVPAPNPAQTRPAMLPLPDGSRSRTAIRRTSPAPRIRRDRRDHPACPGYASPDPSRPLVRITRHIPGSIRACGRVQGSIVPHPLPEAHILPANPTLSAPRRARTIARATPCIRASTPRPHRESAEPMTGPMTAHRHPQDRRSAEPGNSPRCPAGSTARTGSKVRPAREYNVSRGLIMVPETLPSRG